MAYDPLAGTNDIVEKVAIAMSIVDDGYPDGEPLSEHYRKLARAAMSAIDMSGYDIVPHYELKTLKREANERLKSAWWRYW